MSTPRLNAAAVATIRATLASAGMTQADLADALGVSADTIGRRLTGETDLTLTEVERIAHAIGCAPGDLLGLGATVQVEASHNVASDVDVTVSVGT